jgi:hypothetical protein
LRLAQAGVGPREAGFFGAVVEGEHDDRRPPAVRRPARVADDVQPVEGGPPFIYDGEAVVIFEAEAGDGTTESRTNSCEWHPCWCGSGACRC